MLTDLSTNLSKQQYMPTEMPNHICPTINTCLMNENTIYSHFINSGSQIENKIYCPLPILLVLPIHLNVAFDKIFSSCSSVKRRAQYLMKTLIPTLSIKRRNLRFVKLSDWLETTNPTKRRCPKITCSTNLEKMSPKIDWIDTS